MKDDDFLELFGQIRTIRSRIETIERTQEILVRAEARNIVPALEQAFGADPLLARIYLAVDGTKTQSQILADLKAAGHAASSASVSRKLDRLEKDFHLIDLADRTKAGKIYRKGELERILRLSRRVEKLVGG
jgi:hypothetical protein